ncbi:mechanosensitive ion channel domain-containing protein [Micromonospora sp. NPDC050495]|uniref:mechanosensitive ion channel family protein n=1 Tax=Micromonospora sp. NPDC050495 TaxID=3154936 RepID=UPI00340D41B7
MITQAVFVLILTTVVALLVTWLVGRLARRLLKARVERFLSMARVHPQPAFSILAVAWSWYYALPATGLSPEVLFHLRHWDQLVAIGAAGWFVTKLLHLGEQIIFWRRPRIFEDERIRRTRTHVKVIRQTAVALVLLVTVALMLLTFRPVRAVGISILASAGVLGLLVGITARESLRMAIAGLQIAFSAAVHLDDVLVVDGDWGQVEEIALTHVVLRTWDKRRLVLPNTYFTNEKYENWTRFGSTVAGSVDIHVDFSADLNQVREAARRFLEASPAWDRGDWEVRMTDMGEQTATVRITATARDGHCAWSLRCELREGMVAFLRTEHPQWLPRRPKYEV